MKKILAIVLAAIMAFSLGVIGFAEDAEAPALPVQTEGKVYFASEKTEVEAGQVYQIPVYLIANYTAKSGTVVMGFKAKLTGDAAKYMKIIAISPTEDTQKLANYTLLGNDTEQLAFTTTATTVLKSEKLAIAYVLVEVASDYAGQITAEDGTVTAVDAELELSNPDYTKYLDNANALLASGSEIAVVNGVNVAAIDVDYVSAAIVQYIPLPWYERVRNWFLDQSDKLLTFLAALCQTLAGLLPAL